MERTFTTRSELETILIEQALAMTHELEAVAEAAPDGQVLAVAELAAVRAGRELTRRALEAALQGQAASAEKKGLPAGPAPGRPPPHQGQGVEDDRDGRRPDHPGPPPGPLPLLRAGGLPA